MLVVAVIVPLTVARLTSTPFSPGSPASWMPSLFRSFQTRLPRSIPTVVVLVGLMMAKFRLATGAVLTNCVPVPFCVPV